MYFAFENLSSTALADLIENVSAQLVSAPGASAHAYALVDCAFDENLLNGPGLRKLQRACLYEGTRLSAFGAASPFLLRLPDERSAQAESITLLAGVCGNRPMWSVIVTHLGLHELGAHFRPFLLGRCADGLEWPIRWGDVRVIEPLLGTLSKNYFRDLLSPFRMWLVPTRRGSLRIVAGDSVSCPTPGYTCLNISDLQFSQLLDQSEADAVIAQISDTQADLLIDHRPSELYVAIVGQLKKASEIGLLASPLRLHFSTFALILAPGFERHPEYMRLLENIAKGATYYEEVESLSEKFWRATSV